MTIGIDSRLYSLKNTGIGRYLAELIKHISLLDQENHYILYFNQPEFDAFQIPNERFQKKLVDVPHYSLDEQLRFWRFLEQEPVDFFHFPHFNAPMFLSKPYIVTIHDLTLHYYPSKYYEPRFSLKKSVQVFLYKMLMKRVVLKAKHIIAVSKNTKQDLLKEYPGLIDKRSISVVYEGVPEHFQKSSKDEIEMVTKKLGIEKPYFLYTGVYRSHKNLIRLFEAFSKLLQKYPALQLVIAGKKDESLPEIATAINRLQLEGKVVLTGFVSDEDLIALTGGALAFVFPSLYEGFGLPPLEAMQLEIPVVSSNAASLPEVLGDGALYFDPTNTDEIAAQMEKIISDENLRKSLIEKGKANAERYSWQRMSREILDIYKNIGNNTNFA